MGEVVHIVENDADRDRKTCIALDLKVSGANRELAQWLLDHPRYTGTDVAGWLGCGPDRIRRLRNWAKNRFSGHPHDISNRSRALTPVEPLATNENFDPEMIESPEQIRENILDTISRSLAVAGAYRKVLKVSFLEQGAKDEISVAIGKLINKWQSLQAALAPKGERHEAYI